MNMNKHYKTRMNVFLDKETVKKMKSAAAAKGQFTSDFIKELFEEYLKKDKEK